MRQQLRQLAQLFKARDVATSDDPHIAEMKSWQDAATELAAKCEALKQANARLAQERELLLDYALDADDCMWAVQDIADAWAEIAIQSAKDYNRVTAELAALTGKATDADKAEQAEPQEPLPEGEYAVTAPEKQEEPAHFVVPKHARPKSKPRTVRGKRMPVDDTASAG